MGLASKMAFGHNLLHIFVQQGSSLIVCPVM